MSYRTIFINFSQRQQFSLDIDEIFPSARRFAEIFRLMTSSFIPPKTLLVDGVRGTENDNQKIIFFRQHKMMGKMSQQYFFCYFPFDGINGERKRKKQ